MDLTPVSRGCRPYAFVNKMNTPVDGSNINSDETPRCGRLVDVFACRRYFPYSIIDIEVKVQPSSLDHIEF